MTYEKCLKMLEKSRKHEHFYGMEMGWKKWFINISDDEKWLIFMIENSLKMDDEKSFINMIGFWKWLMKISENGKPIINTSEIIFWIMIWKIMISMRIKMFALNSMEKKCMNNLVSKHTQTVCLEQN